jgi:NADH dehydrogenase
MFRVWPIPLKEDINRYFTREVLPFAPEAWMDVTKNKIGYEISFIRHFYSYNSPRELEDIDKDLKSSEEEFMRLTMLQLPQDHGRIRVDQGLEVMNTPGIWAIGDCALVQQIDGNVSPPTAQHALRQAKTCAQNILASMRGTKKQVFAFTGLGKLGSLGRRSAVAEIFGIHLKGLVAWMLWRGVYATKFPGLDGQIRLLVDWVLDVFLPRDITQLRLFHEEPVHREHFEAGQQVFGMGDVGDKVYFIAKGQVAVVKDGEPVAYLADGEMFGETALVCNSARNATVRSLTAVDVVVVSRPAFQELLTNLPGLSASIETIMSARTGRRVDLCGEVARAMDDKIKDTQL